MSRTICSTKATAKSSPYVEAERHEARQGDDATVDEVVLFRSISRTV